MVKKINQKWNHWAAPKSTPEDDAELAEKNREGFFDFLQKVKEDPKKFLGDPHHRDYKITSYSRRGGTITSHEIWWKEALGLNHPKNYSPREFLDALRHLYVDDILIAEEKHEQGERDVQESKKLRDEILEVYGNDLPKKVGDFIDSTEYADYLSKFDAEGINEEENNNDGTEISEEFILEIEESIKSILPIDIGGTSVTSLEDIISKVERDKSSSTPPVDISDIKNPSPLIKLHYYLNDILISSEYVAAHPNLAHKVRNILDNIKKKSEHEVDLDNSVRNNVRNLITESEALSEKVKEISSGGLLTSEKQRRAIERTDDEFDEYIKDLKEFSTQFKNLFGDEVNNTDLSDAFYEKYSPESRDLLDKTWKLKSFYNELKKDTSSYKDYDKDGNPIDKNAQGLIDSVIKQRAIFKSRSSYPVSLTGVPAVPSDTILDEIIAAGDPSALTPPTEKKGLEMNVYMRDYLKSQEVEKAKAVKERILTYNLEDQIELLQYRPIGSKFSEIKFKDSGGSLDPLFDATPSTERGRLIKKEETPAGKVYHFKNNGRYVKILPRENGGYEIKYWYNLLFNREDEAEYKHLLDEDHEAYQPPDNTGQLITFTAHIADDSFYSHI